MRELTNIKKYGGYFHDGLLYDIQIKDSDILLFIESAQMDPDEFEKGFKLTKDNLLKGILCLKNVTKVFVNRKLSDHSLSMISECAEIYDLFIEDNKVEVNISWSKYDDKSFDDFTSNEIYCERVIFYIDESDG
ncbi:MAG: hypothetical protein ACOYK9_01535 [Chlamydiia bacterium]